MSAGYRYDVAIVGGFGHVGLPLGMALAGSGMQVALHDIDDCQRTALQTGRMAFVEHGGELLLKSVIGKSLHLCSTLSDVADATMLLITVGTAIDGSRNPEARPILELAEQVTPYLRRDHCVILCSTVYPGTTESLNEFFKRRGLDVHLAFCPIRTAEGRALRELHELPQIVSGFTEMAVRRAEALFQGLGIQTIEVTVLEAELAKLFTNAWRYIQFAVSNQFYMLATQHGADYARIYHAMTHGYERAQGLPRPGFAAGPCLPKDTLRLVAFDREHFQLGHAAMRVNEHLPDFIVRHLRHSLRSDLTGRRVGILGMAFKADVDDVRGSLSYRLATNLRAHGASVICSDEHVKDPTFVSKEELLAACPIVIIGVPHRSYRELVVPGATHLVDLWGVVKSRSRSADGGSSSH
jgi:UDP-N-acetyl-D-mannosaminuronic acid dehydrogenase